MYNFAINNEMTEGSDLPPFLTNNLIYKGYDIMAKRNLSKPVRICQVDGCGKKHDSHGYCGKHNMQMKNHGRLLQRTKYDKNELVINGDDCIIYLYNMKAEKIAETVIDATEANNVKGIKWGLSYYNYAKTDANIEERVLSRWLMRPIPRGIEIDHKDGDTLNNRKSNLRYATSSQNSANTLRKPRASSNFKGVYFDPRNSRWYSRATYQYKTYYLGRFDSKTEAALAYNKKAIEIHGEFAKLNIIDEGAMQ